MACEVILFYKNVGVKELWKVILGEGHHKKNYERLQRRDDVRVVVRGPGLFMHKCGKAKFYKVAEGRKIR